VFVDAIEKQPDKKIDSSRKNKHFPTNTRLVAGIMAAVSGLDMSMLTYSARLATFNTEHQLTRRNPRPSRGPMSCLLVKKYVLHFPISISQSDHDSLLAPASSSNLHPTATTMPNVFTAP
jgi:hypothetical protein